MEQCRDALNSAISKCPFLHNVATRQGESYARRIACRPFEPAASSAGPVFQEDLCSFDATFRLFHGSETSTGIVPLAKRAPAAQPTGSSTAASPAWTRTAPAGPGSDPHPAARDDKPCARASRDGPVSHRVPIRAPYASIGMSAFNFLVRIPDLVQHAEQLLSGS